MTMKLRSIKTLSACLAASLVGLQVPASGQDETGPLSDITNISGDFFQSPWLGTFSIHPEAEGWVWHVDHGWLFAEPSGPNGLFLFDPIIPGWLYSERGLYPYMYIAEGDGEWIYFDEWDVGPGNHPRTFFSFETDSNFYLPMVGLPNLVETATSAGIFNTLLTAATEAGLAGTLANDGPFTVFAPTDDAFAALGAAAIDDLLEDTELLADILLYHVLPGKIFSRDVSSGWVTAANGADIRIDADYSGVTLNGTSNVIEVDIGASNGVVHVIDEVIMPPASIADVANSAGTFSTLLAALTAAELDTLFADINEGPFTVFAPTDDAFNDLPEGTVASLLEPENRDQLISILTYHVVAGTVYSNQLQAGAVESLQGSDLFVSFENGDVFISGAQVTATDIRARNGVIHVIDTVMMPPASIPEVATEAGIFDTLLTAVTEAGLAGLLSGDGPFTVFAPTDDAFADLPAGVLEELLEPENIDQLVDILSYHVVSGTVYSASLNAGPVSTLLEQDILISFSSGDVIINGNSTVIAADVLASNGVIHVIDTVLLPPVSIAETASINGLSALVDLVVEAGLADALVEGGPFTVFAPTDDAFDAVDEALVQHLLANPEVLADILTYHIVEGTIYSTQIQEGLATTLQGSDIEIAFDYSNVILNGSSTVIIADVLTNNGVVHVIDQVLLPYVSIPETAAEAGIFETLLAAVTAADLADVLGGPGPFTVFAPTDEAFENVDPAVINFLLQPENQDLLIEVLSYHVVDAGVYSGQLEEGPVTMLNSSDITVTFNDGEVIINGSATVVAADVLASNGVIHVIDEVLLPLDTIPGVATAAGTFETLLAAVTTAELAEVLGGPGPFTVFAPNDDAFDNLPDGTVASLLEPENRDLLVEILSYHVVPGIVFSSQLETGLVTPLAGGDILVTIGEGVVLNGSSSVIAADILAANGVIHVIDEVLLPPAETFVIGFDSSSFQYTINGEIAPDLELVRGQTYLFARSDFAGHPFALSTAAPGSTWNESDLYGSEILTSPSGFLYTPDSNTPSMLYYRCTVHASMGAGITVLDSPSSNPTTVIPEGGVETGGYDNGYDYGY